MDPNVLQPGISDHYVAASPLHKWIFAHRKEKMNSELVRSDGSIWGNRDDYAAWHRWNIFRRARKEVCALIDLNLRTGTFRAALGEQVSTRKERNADESLPGVPKARNVHHRHVFLPPTANHCDIHQAFRIWYSCCSHHRGQHIESTTTWWSVPFSQSLQDHEL